MKITRENMKAVAGVLLLAGLLIGLVVVIQTLSVPAPSTPASQSLGGVSQGTKAVVPKATKAVEATKEDVASTPTKEAPYPPPTVTPLLTATSMPEVTPSAAPLPEQPPLPEGFYAVTIHNGNIWLVTPQKAPEALTTTGDITVIFDLNRDHTRLLFGRVRVEQPEYVGDTTALWVLDMSTREIRQVIPDDTIKTALWSPVDDRIATCDLDHTLKVMDLEGKVLNQLERVICGFSWSPDGSSIAVGTYTPEIEALADLKWAGLTVWSPVDGTMAYFGENNGQVHDEAPLWSIDGEQILFQRIYYQPEDMQGLSGLHVVDIASGQIERLDSPSLIVQDLSRSPRADIVVFQDQSHIFVTDFEGHIEEVGPGASPLWLPDGATILYRTLEGELALIGLDIAIQESTFGGQVIAPSFYSSPEYFIFSGE